MKSQAWNLDQLKTQLSSRPEVKGWIVTQEHVHRRERYFLSDQGAMAVDQDRETESSSTYARIFVRHSRPGRQGEVTKKLSPAKPLGPQLEAAVEAAKATDHQSWELPTQLPEQQPRLVTTDPRIAEDMEGVVTKLTNEIAAVVGEKRATAFNSAELFVSTHDRELHLSNGLVHRGSQSRIYAESAFSMTREGSDGQKRSDEYLNTQWSVSLDDLSISRLFEETSARAEHSLDVIKPETGKYSVIVDSEVLAHLFHSQLGQFSARNLYNRLPFLKPGSDYIREARGDMVSIALDPSLDFGADTVAVSDQGVVQQRLDLVLGNQVVNTATDKQYGDYLGISPSTARGNIVVDGGTLTYPELTRVAPKVIEILQFSGLFSDPNTGTFSSEIRLARLHDNVRGTVTYLKGGSLSGSINDNFKGIRLCKERVRRAHFASDVPHGQGYFGPSHALLTDVSIVG